MGEDRWIRRYHPADDAPARLVCLAHAGGAASYFHPVSRALSPAADVLAVQYPGRQDRLAEPPLRSVPELADAITAALLPWLDRPVVLFGHSMGATLAFEIGLRLEARGTAPHAVVVSGRRAPSRHREETVHLRDDEGLIADVALLDGTDSRVFEDPELREMVLPALRADYTAIETYRPAADAQLTVPLHAHTGEADPRAGVDEVRAWSAHTSGDFTFTAYPGGHFYLNEQAPALIAALRTVLAPAS
jgi:surfactin synthase thioesterase subunit